MHLTATEMRNSMKLWFRPITEQRWPGKSVLVGDCVRQLTLLTLTLVGFSGPYLQGYQGFKDEILAVNVTDTDGEAMPNVEVVLMREGKLLAQVKTGADGHASVRMRGGGLTTLSVHQTGYIPVEQIIDSRSIPVPALEIKMSRIPQARETVNVQATTEDISEQSSSPGASIKPTEANESPSRPLTLTDALPLVPGVVRAPNGQTQIEGAGEMHSALLINSIDVSDPATGRFGLSVPLDVVDSLHVLTSPYEVQYGRFTAGVVAAETRSGGNKWHFDLNDPLPEFRIRSGDIRGLKSATPRVSFGGPIVQNRALLSEALEFVDNKIPIRTLSFPFNETKVMSVNSFMQADFTLTARQTFTTTFHVAPESIRYANLNFFNPQPVTPNADTRSYTGGVAHRLAIGSGLLQSTVSFGDIATTISPQGTLGMTVLPTGNSGNYFEDQRRRSHRFEWNELWSLRPTTILGMHKIQVGSSVATTNDEGELHAKTITMFDDQGVKLRTIDFTTGSPFDRSDLQPAAFVQDHWTLNSYLGIDAGLRAEAQTITATTRVAPRVGFVWRPTVGEHTTVRGGIGTFYDSVPLNVYAFNHYPEQIITTYQPNGTVEGTPQHYLNLTSEAAASDFPFVGRDRKIGNFAPYTVAWNFEAEHQFSERFTMRAKYLESHGSGLVTISPQVVQGQDAVVLAGDGSSKYRQFELTAQLSLQPNNRIYASYVRSLSHGTLNESDTYLGDFSSPFIRGNLYANRAGDLPNRFLTWGSVALPWRVKVFPMIEWRSGFPYQSIDVYQNYIRNEKGYSTRFPIYFSADARVAKDVKLDAKHTLRPSISVTNITNHFNALDVHANTGDPQYGQFFGNYDRHMRFDLDLVF
jgi:hypothetical protein